MPIYNNRIEETKQHRILSSLGVPKRYHTINKDYFNFYPIQSNWNKKVMITPDKQTEFFSTFMKNINKGNRITDRWLVMSRPDDSKAMNLVSATLQKFRKYNYSVKMLNSSMLMNKETSDIHNDLIVLYSLNSSSTNWKLDCVRDVLNNCEDSCVIVVCTSPVFGDKAMSVYDFNNNFLNYRFNGLLEIR